MIFLNFFLFPIDKINKVFTKIKYILANIKKYIGIIQTVEFKEAFELCKGSLARLFRMIKPRKMKIKWTQIDQQQNFH